MSNSNDALSEIKKIGNYAIPTFGAVLTTALAVGAFPKSAPGGQAIVINFALYTLAAAWVAYAHRISYLRRRRAQQERNEKPTNLPLWGVIIFMLLHLTLIGSLSYRVWPLSTLEIRHINKQEKAVGANKAMKANGVEVADNSE